MTRCFPWVQQSVVRHLNGSVALCNGFYRQISRFSTLLIISTTIIISVGSANDSSCLNSLLSFENLAQDIGIPLNEGKRCPPSTCQIVYGIEIDTTTMQLRLPADKLAKATSLIFVNTMVNSRKVSLRNLLSLIGLLSHCCLVVQLPNGVLGVKRVLGYGKRFIVDCITWTCHEPKSAGCHLGTLEEFFL